MRWEYFLIGLVFLAIGALILAKGFSKSEGKSTIKGRAVRFIGLGPIPFGPIPLLVVESHRKLLYTLGIVILLFVLAWLLRVAGK
ncbi:MAG TPA: hypothetical protein VJJ21_03255 [Candidatus Nanoarchaeia archaeon]|nr:hypothetical protein [Candidatus Nanoarchaeia archaeon]